MSPLALAQTPFIASLSTATGLSASTLSAAAVGGISTIASQGLTSLIAHEGDLGAVVEDFGSSSFLKSLATGVMSAGLLQEMRLGTFGEPFRFADKPQLFLEHGRKALLQSVVQSGLKTAIHGGSFKNLMENIGRGTVAGTLGGYGANQLHDLLPQVGFVPHKFLHGFLGAGMGVIFSRDPETGALSGMISGLTAESFAELAEGAGLSKEFSASLGEFAGPLTVYFTGGDMETSIIISQNAIQNNFCHEEDGLNLAEEEQERFTEDLRWIGENGDQIIDGIDMLSNLVPQLKTAKGVVFTLIRGGTRLYQKVGDPSSQRELSKAPKVKESKTLLPDEGKVGSYGELNKLSGKGDNLSAHHMPHDNYMRSKGVKKNDGVSMMVEDPYPGTGGRHREIHKTLKKQDVSALPRDVLAQSVKTAKKVYKEDGVYTSEIRDSLKGVIKENKNRHPGLFRKDKK